LNNLRWFLALLLAVGLVLFAVAKWRFSVMNEAGFLSPVNTVLPNAEKVGVTVWPDTTVYLRLPVLILLMLGIVYIPMSLWIRAQKLLMGRQIGKLEKEVAGLTAELEQARVELLRPPAASEPVRTPGPIPPQAIPQAPPPPGT
jgi:hypothetical protein